MAPVTRTAKGSITRRTRRDEHLEQQSRAFAAEVRARPSMRPPALRKMIADRSLRPQALRRSTAGVHPQALAASNPNEPTTSWSDSFATSKRTSRRQTGPYLGANLVRMLADTPLVKTCKTLTTLKILLGTHPNLEALFQDRPGHGAR